ncbi:unnamed protein product [Cladocopium goreaui]|uniref:ADP-ribosylation factor n=1 Tax=Cladocopium goreaui TaxID=2562237 RepID=A0A9P1FJM9_9DINO|nr:unnamed protein product [Cladocopium goreaui]
MVRGNISKALTRRPDRTVRPAQCPAWAPLGRALQDFWANGSTSELPPLLYWSNLRSEPEELPPALFFRRPAEMPPVERYALDLCRQQGGRILDVGAGVRVLWRDGKMKTAMEGQVYLMWMWSSC